MSGTTAAADFHNVKLLNGLEAWRRIVVPLKPRSDAKRNALHTSVDAPPRSKHLSLVINDLDDWEKVVEEFELCGGAISDNDWRTILLKTLPSTTHSSLVSSLRTCPTYIEMQKDLDAEVTFLKDFKPDSGPGSAHVAADQAKVFAAEADEDEDEEGVITIDLTTFPDAE